MGHDCNRALRCVFFSSLALRFSISHPLAVRSAETSSRHSTWDRTASPFSFGTRSSKTYFAHTTALQPIFGHTDVEGKARGSNRIPGCVCAFVRVRGGGMQENMNGLSLEVVFKGACKYIKQTQGVSR
eukprot:219-Rhodomonas_salina.2